MAKYISASDLIGDGKYLPAISADDVPTIATLDKMCEAASRLIDHYTRRGDNAFDPAGAETEQTRVFYGTGTNTLWLSSWRISDFISLAADVPVIAPSGFTLPKYRLDTKAPRIFAITEDGFKTAGTIWPDGMPIEIIGKWGFVAVPPDIREAAAQTVVRWWRGKDEGFSGVIGRIKSDQTIIERDLPAPVRMILELWAAKRPTFA